MKTADKKTAENKTQKATGEVTKRLTGLGWRSQFEDNRAETTQLQRIQSMANDFVSKSPWPMPQKKNNTGLPDNLKLGIENLSGSSMDDVKVHRNSDKQAQLNAHAYVQGSEIHLAAGQEKHLPHEAWHVVQQKQGRVQPTMQMKGKVNVHDDHGLEKEADLMGEKSVQIGVVNRDLEIDSTRLLYKTLPNNFAQSTEVFQRVQLENENGYLVETSQINLGDLAYLVDWLAKDQSRQIDYEAAKEDLANRKIRAEVGIQMVANFENCYHTFFKNFPRLQINLYAQIGQIIELSSRFQLEDYSDQIFELISKTLSSGFKTLNDTISEDAQIDVVNRITDLLLFTSLIPIEESIEGQESEEIRRKDIHVLSPNKMVEVIRDIIDNSTEQLSSLSSFEHIELDDRADILDRMLMLSLVNMSSDLRSRVLQSSLFQLIKANGSVMGGVLLGSSGCDEQAYLSTCAASAMNQEVLSNISSIAGLVHMGNEIAYMIMNSLASTTLEIRSEPTGPRDKPDEKLEDTVKFEVQRARESFRAIKDEAEALIKSGRTESSVYSSLTKRWGVTMQELITVIDPEQGANAIAVLTAKAIPNQYLLSGLKAIPNVFDRPGRRAKPSNAAKYAETSSAIGLAMADTDKGNPSYELNVEKKLLPEAINALWLQVFYRNGTRFNTKFHALYLKAVLKSQKFFLIGDPKVDYYEYKTLEEMQSYVKGKRFLPDVVASVKRHIQNLK